MYMDGKEIFTTRKKTLATRVFSSTLEWLGSGSDYCKTGGGTVSFWGRRGYCKRLDRYFTCLGGGYRSLRLNVEVKVNKWTRQGGYGNNWSEGRRGTVGSTVDQSINRSAIVITCLSCSRRPWPLGQCLKINRYFSEWAHTGIECNPLTQL